MFRASAVLASLLLLSGCAGGKVVDGSGKAPDWSFTDLDGARHSRDSSKGEPTLLFFMATWCTKCQATAPRLTELHHAYMGKPLNLYTVSHDPSEDAADLQGWKENYKQMWPHGVDQGSTIAKTFGITSQSSIVILDVEGRESKKWIYATPSVADLRAAIDAASAT